MLTVSQMSEADWPAVRAILQEGIASGDATFERETPDWETWDADHLPCCRLIAREKERVVGWAALSSISHREAYAGVAEVSVYVAAAAQGKGVGTTLLQALVEESEKAGVWTLQAAVFPENVASLALHRRCGFRRVGFRERIGRLEDVWRDTVLLERRSGIIGVCGVGLE